MSERNELLKIIASQLNNTAPDVEITDWRNLLKIAKAHGLLQYVAFYAEALPEDKKPDSKIQDYLSSVIMQETARSANQLDAVAEMQDAMEQNGVYNLAVKGSVTKLRYENELLRTMGDIDLLYKPEQHHVFSSESLVRMVCLCRCMRCIISAIVILRILLDFVDTLQQELIRVGVLSGITTLKITGSSFPCSSEMCW